MSLRMKRLRSGLYEHSHSGTTFHVENVSGEDFGSGKEHGWLIHENNQPGSQTYETLTEAKEAVANRVQELFHDRRNE